MIYENNNYVIFNNDTPNLREGINRSAHEAYSVRVPRCACVFAHTYVRRTSYVRILTCLQYIHYTYSNYSSNGIPLSLLPPVSLPISLLSPLLYCRLLRSCLVTGQNKGHIAGHNLGIYTGLIQHTIVDAVCTDNITDHIS